MIYVRQNLVVEYLSKLRTSKVTFDLGFRIEYFCYVGQSCCLLNLMVQLYNYMTSKIVSRCVLRIYYNYVTSTFTS